MAVPFGVSEMSLFKNDIFAPSGECSDSIRCFRKFIIGFLCHFGVFCSLVGIVAPCT